MILYIMQYFYYMYYKNLYFSLQFLGSIEVDQAKGIDVVKDGIRKLKVFISFKKICILTRLLLFKY